jgi:N-sulfoglucosamine sulfohydrolase
MITWNRRAFLKSLCILPAYLACQKPDLTRNRPNFLLLMSDNHSWNHLGCYGDPVVKTPNIDAVAGKGVRFTHAFCAAPSCSPARAGMLTGQDIWRLEEGANLWGILPNKFTFFTDLLSQSGYTVGCQGKGWGPGSVEDSGRMFNHGGKKYDSFENFINEKPKNTPWCFWFSSQDPHRPYEVGSGEKSGMDKSKVKVPGYLPDTDEVRGDICDYYFEIERFDSDVGKILETLKQIGEYGNTVILICSDNGWQMPRGLANLYDFGTRIPLIISWQENFPVGRVVDDFVNLNDLAPTFLELAELEIPPDMTAKSLTPILFSKQSGRIDPNRNFIITARERHALCRKNGLGYPGRAIRNYEFLYIRNYEPDRWPAGDPPLFGDVDAHMLHYPCPTKLFILANKEKRETKLFFNLAFGKRPAEELYDLKKDPDQMNNMADQPEYDQIKRDLSEKLTNILITTNDPRETGGEIIWDNTAYYEKNDFNPKPSEEAIRLLGLKKEYSYY